MRIIPDSTNKQTNITVLRAAGITQNLWQARKRSMSDMQKFSCHETEANVTCERKHIQGAYLATVISYTCMRCYKRPVLATRENT